MEKLAIEEAARRRAAITNDGASAAREGGHRTDNPHAAETENWLVWRDGFEQQLAWSQQGRGDYHVSASTSLVPLR